MELSGAADHAFHLALNGGSFALVQTEQKVILCMQAGTVSTQLIHFNVVCFKAVAAVNARNVAYLHWDSYYTLSRDVIPGRRSVDLKVVL